MAEVTYRRLLSDAKAAMQSILVGGQSYTVDGRTFNRANLRDLQTLISNLETLAYEETSGDSSGIIQVRSGELQ